MTTDPARRPLTAATTLFAFALGGWAVVTLLMGSRYIVALNSVDATTPLMISILLLRGVYAQRAEPDLRIVSVSLIGALSFIYAFEAIYKFLFMGWVHHSPELRELLLQIATALTVLLPFQIRALRLSRASIVLLVLFAGTMLFWWLIGYPQLDTPPRMVQYIVLPVSKQTVYLINRGAKFFLFAAYFFFYQRDQRGMGAGMSASA